MLSTSLYLLIVSFVEITTNYLVLSLFLTLFSLLVPHLRDLGNCNSAVCNFSVGGTQRSWLKHYATSRKVAGSSPDEVDFFHFT
jgi:hypothetical protein